MRTELIAIDFLPKKDNEQRIVAFTSESGHVLSVEEFRGVSSNAIIVCCDGMEACRRFKEAGLPLPANLCDLQVEWLNSKNNTLELPKRDKREIGVSLNPPMFLPWLVGECESGFEMAIEKRRIFFRGLIDEFREVISQKNTLDRGEFIKALFAIQSRGIPIDVKIYHKLIPRMRLLLPGLDESDDDSLDFRADRIRGEQNSADVPNLHVDPTGRSCCRYKPFASKTGRVGYERFGGVLNAPSVNRGLICPRSGTAIVELDFVAQDFGAAAAITGDRRMMEFYKSGDPYEMFGEVLRSYLRLPRVSRSEAKIAALMIQYGGAADVVGGALMSDVIDGGRAILAHECLFPDYHCYIERMRSSFLAKKRLVSASGWGLSVKDSDSHHQWMSYKSFFPQALGADILQKICVEFERASVRCIGTLHDSFLIEVDVQDLEETTRCAEAIMRNASQNILMNLELNVTRKVCRGVGDLVKSSKRGVFNILMKRAGVSLSRFETGKVQN